MAQQYRHARYFRVRSANDSSLFTFANTDLFTASIALKSAYNTSSPTVTKTLEDGGKTMKIVFEFDSASDQQAFKDAVDGAWGDSVGDYPFRGGDKTGDDFEGDLVEHFKTEWYATDGTTVDTSTDFGNFRK